MGKKQRWKFVRFFKYYMYIFHDWKYVLIQIFWKGIYPFNFQHGYHLTFLLSRIRFYLHLEVRQPLTRYCVVFSKIFQTCAKLLRISWFFPFFFFQNVLAMFVKYVDSRTFFQFFFQHFFEFFLLKYPNNFHKHILMLNIWLTCFTFELLLNFLFYEFTLFFIFLFGWKRNPLSKLWIHHYILLITLVELHTFSTTENGRISKCAKSYFVHWRPKIHLWALVRKMWFYALMLKMRLCALIFKQCIYAQNATLRTDF